eukprot:g7898.t1
MRGCTFLAAFLAAATRVGGHPICTDDTPPVVDQVLEFCPAQQAGVCCTDLDEDALEIIFQDAGTISDECAGYYKQVVCARCHSYSGHLYARLWPPLPIQDGLTMKKDFCRDFVDACTGEGNLEFPTYSQDSGTFDYCEMHAGPESQIEYYWSYPFVQETTFEPGLTLAFPNLDDDDKPGQTLTLKQSPDGSMFWIVGQLGEIIKVDAGDTGATAAPVINLGPHNTPSLDVNPTGVFWVASEEGLLDVAFDPNFTSGSGDAFYLSYTVKYDGDNRPRNRFSKFLYYPGDPGLTRASEETLLTTITKIAPIHASGWLDFRPSDFKNPGPVGTAHDIYWSSGDGGKKVDQQNRGQDPTNLLGAIIRISVSATTAGYTIPEDGNNVAGGGDSDIREEICAYGFRNPFRCGFDLETDKLYCGDVGHNRVEEIDLIECGKNYGWRILEGDRCHAELTEDVDCDAYDEASDRLGFTSPYFQYCHDDYDSTQASEQGNIAGIDVCGDRQITGRCVIGGYVYRGELFADLLYGAYVFGDNETRNIHYILEADDGTITVGNIISDGSVAVIGFAQGTNGEMMVIDQAYDIYHLPCGDLCDSTCLDKSENLPTFQSEGCFVEVASDQALPIQAPGCPNGQDAMTAEICFGRCFDSPYFATQYGRECWCGSDDGYTQHGPSTGCNVDCRGNPGEICGGSFAASVYRNNEFVPDAAVPPGTPSPVNPPDFTPLGCFQDKRNDRIMTRGSRSDTNMKAEVCVEICVDSPFFATQYGRECWCGSTNDYYRHGESTGCTVECTGNADEICGGGYAASVYSNDGVKSVRF